MAERSRTLLRERGGKWCRLEVTMDGCGSDGRLSICGSAGHTAAEHRAKGYGRGCETLRPAGNGSRPSSSYHYETGGQCVAEIVAFFPEVAHWMPWHLNDMRAECEHQEALGWREAASEERTLYHWRIRPELAKERRNLVASAERRFRAGEAVQATPEELRLLALPDRRTTTTDEAPVTVLPSGELAVEYVANGPQYEGDTYNRTSEVKARGWLRPSEHPDGLLGKPCPTCGYGYGNEWKRRELPARIRDEVERFLADVTLPALPVVAS